MARGDLTIFEEFAENIGGGDHDLTSDTLKLGLIDSTSAPTAADATPTWGDYSGNEVAASAGYSAGGSTVASTSYTEADGVATLDGNNVTFSQNGSGFTDAYYGVLYNSTHASSAAIAWIDLDGPVSQQDGDVTITWNSSGICTVTVS